SPDAIADRLEGELFAMADPTVAPVGNYGKAALESLGLWAVAGSVLVPTRNTISTVQAVASGETVLGLVYASDAKGVADVTVVAELPASSHPAIEYPIAALTEASDPEGAAGFLEFLGSQEAAEILAAHGFTPLGLDN
ncbi:MAG: molybdate ABC transporter substrate-binding protein, partial [Mangrovicoccus sp.]